MSRTLQLGQLDALLKHGAAQHTAQQKRRHEHLRHQLGKRPPRPPSPQRQISVTLHKPTLLKALRWMDSNWSGNDMQRWQRDSAAERLTGHYRQYSPMRCAHDAFCRPIEQIGPIPQHRYTWSREQAPATFYEGIRQRNPNAEAIEREAKL